MTEENKQEDIKEDRFDESQELIEEFSQEIMINRTLLKRIQNTKYSIHSEFSLSLWDRLGLKPKRHHMYYGVSINETILEISRQRIK